MAGLTSNRLAGRITRAVLDAIQKFHPGPSV
jgi:hypothetical protein